MGEKNIDTFTCSAPINIAIIKYWGKRCERFNLPLNASLSVTLHQEDLKATTSASTSRSFERDQVWLNGVEQDVTNNKRIQACLTEIRRLARKQAIKQGVDAAGVTKYSQKVRVCSRNNFPTAAGLASSAAGYAAFVAALGGLFKVEGDLSHIARQGSGSACRSMYGGFVEWVAGEELEGADSVADQFLTEDHWPELRVFIVVASQRQKTTGSTVGMGRSKETSELLERRVADVVPARMAALKEAISNRDFSSFAEICMKESNQLHAICRDTYPPLQYLNPTSNVVIDLVHSFNRTAGKTKLAYTFDAGPNAFLFTLEPNANEIATFLQRTFNPDSTLGSEFIRGSSSEQLDLKAQCDFTFPPLSNSVAYIIYTKAGPGPLLVENESLICGDSGLPKATS